MARKKKKDLSIEEELMELGREITECENKIKQLADRKKELKQLIEQKQMEALLQAVQKSGKSIEEVIAWINSESQDGEQDGEGQ